MPWRLKFGFSLRQNNKQFNNHCKRNNERKYLDWWFIGESTVSNNNIWQRSNTAIRWEIEFLLIVKNYVIVCIEVHKIFDVPSRCVKCFFSVSWYEMQINNPNSYISPWLSFRQWWWFSKTRNFQQITTCIQDTLLGGYSKSHPIKKQKRWPRVNDHFTYNHAPKFLSEIATNTWLGLPSLWSQLGMQIIMCKVEECIIF